MDALGVAGRHITKYKAFLSVAFRNSAFGLTTLFSFITLPVKSMPAQGGDWLNKRVSQRIDLNGG